MRPVGKYRFKLTGEKQELEDYFIVTTPTKTLFTLSALQIFYLWLPAPQGITSTCWSCVIRKVKQ